MKRARTAVISTLRCLACQPGREAEPQRRHGSAAGGRHFGHIGVNSCIKPGQALDPCNMAWLEGMIPLQFHDQWRQITDAAQEHGVAMAMHFAATPISCMANVHSAAATENSLSLENHSVDAPWWDDMVTGIDKPIVNRGYIKVPDGPGLGINPVEDVIKQHLHRDKPGFFEPTDKWNPDRVNDRLWS